MGQLKQKWFKFSVYIPSELSAGIRGFSDTVAVIVYSGDPGGDPGEFEAHIKESLMEWYDGGKVESE